MTITFFSNFLNIHQLPFCEELIERIGEDNFKFVATTKIHSDRVSMGFVDMNEIYPFVVKAYEGGAQLSESHRLARESDVAIIGSASYVYSDERLALNKLTFNYSERLFKKGLWMLFYPPKFIRSWHFYTRTINKPNYVLCASAYTKKDVSRCLFPKDKCFKWGYFPKVRHYSDIDELIKGKIENSKLKRKGVSILWVGRLIELKHPEAVIFLANRLKKAGYDFNIEIIGEGILERKINHLIEKNELTTYVQLLGALPPDEVRAHMEKAEIFIFTSDRNEGWGAVLNESMNSACAVVASSDIGSVPFLIENNKNGMTFHSKNWNDLYLRVKCLIDNPIERANFGKCAYYTITKEWSAGNAVDRFVKLIEIINKGEDTPFLNGPCSKA